MKTSMILDGGRRDLPFAVTRLRLYPTGLQYSKTKTVMATTVRHMTNIITQTAGLYGSTGREDIDQSQTNKTQTSSVGSDEENFVHLNKDERSALTTNLFIEHTVIFNFLKVQYSTYLPLGVFC